MKKVAIIHPWLPQYRIGFFEQLVAKGAEVDIDIRIFYGDAPPEWKDRNDTGDSAGFTRLPTTFYNIRGRTLNRKSLKPVRAQGEFDLIIVEQAVRNLESYRLLLGKTPVAHWGHGKTYTVRVSRVQERLKQWLTRRGHWFFAYTAGGVEAVVGAGFPQGRITLVQNSIDTSALLMSLRDVTVAQVDAFAVKHDLRMKTALFIGGLDSSKRIAFLLKAAAIAYEEDPEFRLLIAGAGKDLHNIKCAGTKLSYVIYLGAIFEQDKALALKSAQVMAMPGRVGLIAVDSFASGTPIVTTDWPWHAPEFEYLEPDVNALVTLNDEKSYASQVVRILNSPDELGRLRAACLQDSSKYTVETMSKNFLTGIGQALRR